MTECSAKWQGKSQQAITRMTSNTNWCCTATTGPNALNSYTQQAHSRSTSSEPLSTYSEARHRHFSASIGTTKSAWLWAKLSRWMKSIAQFLTTCIAKRRRRWISGRRLANTHTTKTYSFYGWNWATRNLSIETQAFHTGQFATQLTFAGNDLN